VKLPFARPISFRARLTVLAAAAVALAVALASMGIFLIVRTVLRGQVDEELVRLAKDVVTVGPGFSLDVELPKEPLGGPRGYVEVIDVLTPGAATSSPAGRNMIVDTNRDIAVASGAASSYFQDLTVRGTHLRVLTQEVGPGVAVQIARPLEEIDLVLGRLAFFLVVLALCGIAVAAMLGGVVARGALAPVRSLTRTAEHVTTTSDLTKRIKVQGGDELASLASSFNSMLEALEVSIGKQRQLVADASHELRTPLTSIRTNIEVLQRSEELSDEERRRLLPEIVAQVEELTMLIGDLVELSRGTEPPAEVEEIRLDLIVQEAVDRAQRHAPEVVFELDLRESVVQGVPARLVRAVANLLDNAIKWNPDGKPVEVTVDRGEVTVRDHGPGISDQDLPYIFDRFYRSAAARGRPGSGLGLAIVQQVAESHGGEVAVEDAEEGGARFRLRLERAA
jgi:two-component system, OmpR family, sensor histidine kinase MprB